MVEFPPPMTISTGLAITITALNLTGLAFQSVNRGLTGIQRTATSVGRGISGLNTRLNDFQTGLAGSADGGLKGLLKLNAGLLALDLTTRAVSATFDTLGNSIGGALDREVEGIQSINTVMATLQLNSKQATSFVQEFNQEVARAGKNLPVSAEKINTFARTIIDDYSAAIVSAGGKASDVRNVLLEDSTRLAIAQAASGTTDGEAQAAIANLLSGALGAKGLNRYKFFANNVKLKNNLQEAIESRGISSLGDISAFDRIVLLNQALETAFPQDAIDRLAESGKAKISRFTDILFDPEIGIFSLTKDLDPEQEGYQSAYTSFKKTLDLTIGENGIFAQFGRLSGLGANSFSTGFKGIVDGFNSILTTFNDQLKGLSNLSGSQIGSAVGRLAADLIDGVTVGALKAIGNINWGETLKGVVSGVGSFFANLDWRTYLTAGVGLLALKVAPIVVAGIAAGLTGFPVLVGGAIVAGIAGIVALIANYWDDIAEGIKGLFEGLKSKIFGDQSGGEPVQSGGVNVQTPSGLYGFGARGFVPSGADAAIAREMAMAPSGTYPVIANSSELVIPGDKIDKLLGAGKKSVNLGGITININGNGDSKAVANEVLKVLEDNLLLQLEAAMA